MSPEHIVEEAVITTMETTEVVVTTTITVNSAKKGHQQSASTVISQVTKRSTAQRNIMKRDNKQETTVSIRTDHMEIHLVLYRPSSVSRHSDHLDGLPILGPNTT